MDLVVWIGTCAIIAYFLGGFGLTIFVMAGSIILVPIGWTIWERLGK